MQSRGIAPGVWGILLIVPALFLLFAGGKAWLDAAQNKTPIAVSYSDFMKEMPKSGWYTITGGTVDVTKSVYWEQNGVCVDVYAPLRPANGRAPVGSELYIEITDPATLSAMQDMTYARKKGGEAGTRQFIAQHRDKFWQQRDVSGLVSYGRRDPLGEWARAGLDAGALTFLADGWRPNPVLGYAGTLCGLASSALSLWLLAKGFLRGRR